MLPAFQSVNLKREPSGREKIIFLAVLIATLILFLDSLWSPQSAKLHGLKNELSSIDQQLSSLKTLVEATQTQIQKASTETDKSAPLNDYVRKVVDRKIVDVAEEVNTTADLMRSKKFANKADVLNVVVGDRGEEGEFIRIPIKIELKGRYSPIREYMQALENIGRPLIVETFQADKSDPKSNELNVKINAVLYIPKA